MPLKKTTTHKKKTKAELRPLPNLWREKTKDTCSRVTKKKKKQKKPTKQKGKETLARTCTKTFDGFLLHNDARRWPSSNDVERFTPTSSWFWDPSKIGSQKKKDESLFEPRPKKENSLRSDSRKEEMRVRFSFASDNCFRRNVCEHTHKKKKRDRDPFGCLRFEPHTRVGMRF